MLKPSKVLNAFKDQQYFDLDKSQTGNTTIAYTQHEVDYERYETVAICGSNDLDR